MIWSARRDGGSSTICARAPGSIPVHPKARALLQKIGQQYALRGWEGATHTAAQLAFLEGRAAMTVSDPG